jgi:hypothetical protein
MVKIIQFTIPYGNKKEMKEYQINNKSITDGLFLKHVREQVILL